MKSVTTEQIKDLERRTISERGVSAEVLMERAGRAVADTVCELSAVSGIARPSVLAVAGRGNNAGDAFVAAGILAGRGVHVDVWLAGEAENIAGDARTHMERMSAAGVTIRQIPEAAGWNNRASFDPHWDIVIDGLLGTGLRGTVHGTMAAAIAMVNRLSRRSIVVAIDVPSGMDADTGMPSNEAVLADLTVTMAFPKKGLLTSKGMEYTGSLVVADIGIYDNSTGATGKDTQLIEVGEIRSLFCRRQRHSHKGSFGHVLVVGGSAGLSGAPAMAARGALRAGAGLVSVYTPISVAGSVAAGVQEAMVHGMKETDHGTLSPDCWTAAGKDLNAFDAVVVGPGLGTRDECRVVVTEIVRRCRIPLVLDADALNVQKRVDQVLKAAECKVTITPHPGELSRFMAEQVETIQADRVTAALRAASATNSTVVLKGAGTIVAEHGKAPFVNMTGNPGMATGGSGDVLAGIVVSLLGQGFSPFDASRAAVYIHGRAGDRAAWRLSQAGVIAGDLIQEIPFVMRELCGR